MSRTYKDKPSKLRHSHYRNDKDFVCVDGMYLYELKLPTTKPKKRKEVDTEWHWMTTPSWWTRLMMNKPQRREVKLWERKALISDLEDLIEPGKKYKHVYFW